jgi:hypothetical protein
MDNSEVIIEMWNWFKSISDRLIENPKDVSILNKIDFYIDKLGSLDWEIGPYDTTTCYFAISPGLDKNLLNETKKIISYSPNCNGWSFLYSKPAKEWRDFFRMLNENEETIEVHTASWQYILYQFEDNTFDVDVKINPINGDINTSQLAVDIVLTNALGEEMYMELINHVNIETNELGNEQNMSFVKDLKAHLLQLI